MRSVEWVIKPSTYCNLRCRYCYEWNGLDDAARMPIDTWRRVVRAAIDYHGHVAARGAEPVTTRIILHGGEPFALPLPYLEALLGELDLATHAAGVADAFTTCVQTNLTVLTPPVVALIRRFGLRLGVSMDVVPGVRVTVAGRETESRVLRNMDTLRDAGIPFGAITVLARHTCAAIDRIFDFWAARGVDIRVLPLFAGPPERDVASFDVGEAELASALCRLFDRWIGATTRIDVAPLDEWLAAVVRHRMKRRAPAYDRRREGESVWVVRPDGALFQTNEVGRDALALGRVDESTIEQILASEPYQASLRRSEAITDAICSGCAFRGGCDGYPAHTEAYAIRRGRRCPVAHHVYAHIERYLARCGLDEEQLVALGAPPS